MEIESQVTINSSKENIWQVITDIEHAASTISGIENIEILEKPEHGLVGLKWRETRTLFGKTAVETMWITDAVENTSYQTRAENHGAVYVTHLSIAEQGSHSSLTMEFSGTAQTLVAKVISASWGPFSRMHSQSSCAGFGGYKGGG